jgi:hypothetical protein
VKNYSNSTVDYVPEMDEEVFFEPEFLYLQYGMTGAKSHSLDEQALAKRIEIKHENTDTKQVSGKEHLRLKPFLKNPNAVYNVTWKHRVTMLEEFCDITEFRYATIGARLRVDKIPDRLRFVSAGDLSHEAGSISWDFSGPFMTGQHVKSWWFRKQTAEEP